MAIYLIYNALVIGSGLIAIAVFRHRWISARNALRAGLIAELGLTAGELASPDAAGWARARIEALVRCVDRSPGGRGAVIWLCFGRSRLLVFEGGVCRALGYHEIDRLAIADGRAGGRCRLAIESPAGPTVAEVSRLEDLVRVINVASRHGLTLGHLKD